MQVSTSQPSGVPPKGLEEINARWRDFFLTWYEELGTKSVRVREIAPIARDCGFDLIVPPEDKRDLSPDQVGSLSTFGTLLRHKHRHVHAGLRLIADRIELGWSSKTSSSTYHLEPKDEPRELKSGGFKLSVGETEE